MQSKNSKKDTSRKNNTRNDEARKSNTSTRGSSNSSNTRGSSNSSSTRGVSTRNSSNRSKNNEISSRRDTALRRDAVQKKDEQNRRKQIEQEKKAARNREIAQRKARNQELKREKKRKKTPEVVAKIGDIDYAILFVTVALLMIGLAMVYSSSFYTAVSKGLPNYYWLAKQLVFAVIGILGMFLTINIDYNTYRDRYPWLFYALTTFLLVLVLFVGKEVNGAKRWLDIGGMSIQPSELAKMSLILLLSSEISREETKFDLNGYARLASIILLPVALVGIENMSTAIIIFLIGAGIVFVASPHTKAMIGIIISFIVLVVGYLFSLMLTKSTNFRSGRITAWLDPFSDPTNYGFQIIQGLYAIASGGLFGLGYGNSRQKYGYIPESHNDIIFAIICEETGFLGAMLLLTLYVILFWRGITVARNSIDLFGTLLASGIIIMIGAQVCINIAVVTNTIPNTGVTLPFISYGGTSLMVMLTAVGVLLNISKYSIHKTIV